MPQALHMVTPPSLRHKGVVLVPQFVQTCNHSHTEHARSCGADAGRCVDQLLTAGRLQHHSTVQLDTRNLTIQLLTYSMAFMAWLV